MHQVALLERRSFPGQLAETSPSLLLPLTPADAAPGHGACHVAAAARWVRAALIAICHSQQQRAILLLWFLSTMQLPSC